MSLALHWAGCIALFILMLFAMRAVYHSGFRDGAHWMWEGDCYPSKPPATWWWYRQAERQGMRPGRVQQGNQDRCPDCAVKGADDRSQDHREPRRQPMPRGR